MSTLIIGTRGSKLALWQAHFVKSQLEELGITATLKIIKTKGDQIQDLSFDKLEGKGFFTKEIEEALLAAEIDLAIHSMKDLPTAGVAGLKIAALSYRATPADWLIVRSEVADSQQLLQLKKAAVVGTSSARRKAQLLGIRPDCQLKDIRGNVPTRLQKLKEGQFDAILLAGAGITRLEIDLSEFTVIKFSPREFIPAPAQGVLALQIREEDKLLQKTLLQLHHPEVLACTNVERKVLQLLQGGCQMPLGVYCEQDTQGSFHVWAALAATWKGPVKQVRLSSSTKAGLAERVFASLQEKE